MKGTLNGVPFESGTKISISGDYTLKVVASDKAGNTVTETVNFAVDVPAPEPEISYKTNDFDGDGKADFYNLYDSSAGILEVWGFSSRKGYYPAKKYSNGSLSLSNSKVLSGEVDGDGKADIVLLKDIGSGNTKVCFFESSNGFQKRTVRIASTGFLDFSKLRAVAADFDGDGKTDIGCLYDYSDAQIGVSYFISSSGYSWFEVFKSGKYYFGLSKAEITPADVNGDGSAEMIALYDYGNAKIGIFVLCIWHAR